LKSRTKSEYFQW